MMETIKIKCQRRNLNQLWCNFFSNRVQITFNIFNILISVFVIFFMWPIGRLLDRNDSIVECNKHIKLTKINSFFLLFT